ncbi:hypothetical protein ASG29_06530 [Sphingomonas sp. Leaf412]|uniref:DNA methyltransferase n=1 Tax=Sphingomonas sp. Leaf412 TaxID=1736370 RepID=UPI0006FD7718|nr:DNA methyltransferase [Sphingomonas sp. Leaf412]KQT33662.1 hypothetical protein ASG29_06530 [Sphingomonas sp. Leaf412]
MRVEPTSVAPNETSSEAYSLAPPPAPLPLSEASQRALIDRARDTQAVGGLTHRHYNYPARFSPLLVAEAIETFTLPGDLVLDPYVGGGTTLVEAYARGREAIGSDISTLATFVANAKLMTLTQDRAERFIEVIAGIAGRINLRLPEPPFDDWATKGYFRNMGTSQRWRLRKAIAQAVSAIEEISDPTLEALARCAVLRTAHWALDGRKQLPSTDAFRRTLSGSASLIVEGALALQKASWAFPGGRPIVLNRSVIGLEADPTIIKAGAPRLIMTSPPYPGVHVLYHRWQVDGRKESPAPFFIAKALDGSGESYYTMGGRKGPGLHKYFDQLGGALRSLASIADGATTLVQVVAFADPEWQLARYLEVADRSGWQEFGLSTLAGEEDGRLWRSVPNRKWHATSRGQTGGAREVVLFHRLRAH